MPRARGITFENSFINGFVTQASTLSYPEHAVVEADNCSFGLLGEVTRRLPFDREEGGTDLTISMSGKVVGSYVWKNVAGNGALSLYVEQVGETLYFYRPPSGAISSGLISGQTVDLTDFSPSAAPSPALNECSFSSGLGFLFVTHPHLEPFYVSFDPELNTITATQIDVQIRDVITGVDDGLNIDERPGALSPEHDYNLRNQGWFTTSRRDEFQTAVGVYPSNADVWWLYKNVDDQYDVAQIAHVERGTTAAPKGHYILNAFNQDRSAASGVGAFDTATTGPNRPTVSAFYAGRLFYAGTNYAGWEARILFSQIVEDVNQTGKCYTSNDPTSETLFDVVPSDGGFFSIPGAGIIHALVPMAQYLIVCAINGIWAISGSTGVGFTATDFKVDQISKIGTIGNKSIVDVRGLPIYWTLDGIYSISQEQQGWSVRNISNDKIRSFYLDIPVQSRTYARGAFNPQIDIIHWVYKSTEAGSIDEIYQFDRVLVYNTATGAFSPWSIPDSDQHIHGIVHAGALQNVASSDIVTDNSLVTVTDNLSANVTVLSTTTSFGASGFKYPFSYSSGSKFSFAEQTQVNFNYTDWGFSSPAAYDSSFVTGFRLKTQGVQPFMSHFLFVYANVEDENTDCSVRSRWDFANTTSAFRWSSPQRVFAATGNFDSVRRKLLIRGRGTVCQFEFLSATEKGFNISGWSSYDTSNQDI